MRLLPLQGLEAHDDGIWTASWIPHSNQLLTGSADETLRTWECTDDAVKQVHTHTDLTLGVISVAVDSTGTHAATSSLDALIHYLKLDDYTEVNAIESAPTEFWSLAMHPEGSLLASAGGTRNSVVVWQLGGAQPSQYFEFQVPLPADERGSRRERFVMSVAFSPDGRRLAAASMDGSVTLFDLEAKHVLGSLDGHFKPVRTLSFTPDSRMLITGCDDMHAHMYDVDNCALIESLSGHESWVLGTAVHPLGNAFVTCSSDSKVKLWDLSSRACVQTLTEHTDQVWCVSFDSEGTRLASAGDDKKLQTYSFS